MITVPPLQSSSPLISSQSDAIYWQKKVTDLYQQMKDQQNLPTTPSSRSLSSASSLTSLSMDISASCSTFFEVLYVGKIKVWNRRVPNTFIDDAIEKFRLHDQERMGRPHGPFERLRSEGNLYRRGSVDAPIELPNLTPSPNVPILQRSLTVSSISMKTPNSPPSTTPEGEESATTTCTVPSPITPALAPEQQQVKLPAISTEDHNRTMVLQVGRTDLRLISPDRKIVLLHKMHRDITTCVQGQKNNTHFGFICREGAANTFIGYVFKCESDSVASETVGAITQAFVNVDTKQSRPAISSCEHCPMVWFHRLCVEIESYHDDKRIQTAIFRRLEQLDDEEQKLIQTKFQGAETDSIRDQNEFLMMLLRAHCEMKQGRHVHDTAENRSEFLNQYLGGSTIFSKAKKSLSNSFDTLLKRRASKDDIGAAIREMTLPVGPASAEGSDRESEGMRSRSSTIGSQSDFKKQPSTSPERNASGPEKGSLKSPMMDIFFKVGSGPKVAAYEEPETFDAGSWRQAIFKRVTVPNNVNSIINPKVRTKKEFQELWKRAIHQAILLVRMEKENDKIRAKQEDNAVKRIKLEYDEMRSTKEDNLEMWDLLTNKESRATLKHDNHLLFQTIRRGIPRTRRGEVWFWLADRWCKNNPPFDSTHFPNYSLPYDKLLKQLTSHQHAILIDLGRTFPSHSYFSSPLGPGQLGLFNLLKAYSLLDPEVGYCQGLSFVAGVLLLHMEESQAFFLLRHLMFRRGLRAQYLPNMISLQVKLYQLSRLIHDELPELYVHFDQYEVTPTLYAAPWILTLFASQFPLGFVTRVFDLVFLENTDVVFKVALVLVSLHKEQLMACEGFEEIMNYLKVKLTEFDTVSLEQVMKHVCVTDISKQLNEYLVEYAVLQEETTAMQPQLEALRRFEMQNKSLNEQNKALRAQLELTLSNVQRLERQRTLQQSHINKIDMQNRGLEVTISTLATFIQDIIDDKVDVEIPDDVRRVLSQITFVERRKSQSQNNNFMKMFKRSDSDSHKDRMVKSLSTGKLALPQLREAQEMVRSRSLNTNTIKQLITETDESPPGKPRPFLTAASTPNMHKPSPFFSSTHSQILQDKLRSPKIDIKIEDCFGKSMSDCTDLTIEQKSNNNNCMSPTNSTDSGVETPGSPKDIEHHPLSNCDVRFTYNGTKELKNIRSLRNTNRNSSPDMLQK